jgi:hypothetical protein
MRLIIAVPIVAVLVFFPTGPADARNPQADPPSRAKQAKQVSAKKQLSPQTRQQRMRRAVPPNEPGFLRIP